MRVHTLVHTAIPKLPVSPLALSPRALRIRVGASTGDCEGGERKKNDYESVCVYEEENEAGSILAATPCGPKSGVHLRQRRVLSRTRRVLDGQRCVLDRQRRVLDRQRRVLDGQRRVLDRQRRVRDCDLQVREIPWARAGGSRWGAPEKTCVSTVWASIESVPRHGPHAEPRR